MRTIRAIFRNGNLEPLDPVGLSENSRVTIALLDADDVPAEKIGSLASQDRAYEFLNDPREDIYSDSDGKAV